MTGYRLFTHPEQCMRLLQETIPREHGRALVCIDSDLPDFACPYHRHPEFEVVRIDESRGRVLAGDGDDRFVAGDLYAFSCNVPHAFLNDPGTKRARSRCLQFPAELLNTLSTSCPEAQTLHLVEIAFSAGFNHLSNFNRQFRQRYECSPREYRKRIPESPASRTRFAGPWE